MRSALVAAGARGGEGGAQRPRQAGPAAATAGGTRAQAHLRANGEARRLGDPLRRSRVLRWLARGSVERFLVGAHGQTAAHAQPWSDRDRDGGGHAHTPYAQRRRRSAAAAASTMAERTQEVRRARAVAADVEIVESCMVPPGDETPKHRLWLSVFDLVQGRVHSPVISLYRPCPGSSAAFFSPDILKAALSQALVPFYPLSGRLGSDSSGRPEIHCTGDGVLFVTARTDTTLDKLENPVPSEELRQMLVPSADAGDHAGVLAMFQVTFFKCGGVCLGTAIHHTACDGRAASNFMKMWAATARGDREAITSLQPCLDRTLLRGRSPPAVRFQHPEYPRRGSVPSTTTTKAPFNTAVLPISKNQVEALKGAAGASASKKVSTYSAVVAHVWQCSCKAKGIGGTAASRIYGVGCLRSRMCPPLPGVYFGNAVALTSTTATKVKDIVSSPLDAVADKVSTAVARMRSDEYVRSLADYLELSMNDTPGLHLGQWAVPDTDLFVVSWIGLPLIDVDFGWGRPSFVGRAMLSQSNLLYLVPSPDGDGQLNVTVTMEPQALSRFKELFYEGLEHYSVVSQKHVAEDAHVVIHAKL